MTTITSIYVTVIGTIFGSFFNVVGYRIVNNESIIFPRSHCPYCGQNIRTLDLIPIFSYLFLKGRCRNCHCKISPLSPIIEGLTGLMFLCAFLKFTNFHELSTSLLLISFVTITIVTDLSTMLIPNKIIVSFFIIYSGYRIIFPMNPWWDPILGCSLIFLLLALIAFLSNGGIGGGDVKLFAVAGILIGTKLVFIGLILALFSGTVICTIASMLKLIQRKQPIPFAPFIAIGMIASLFWGDYLFGLYQKYIL
ncbi:prepilin peptidase [Sporolactobacillus nakayamae]|uniref:Leader peptidase (Prepilin peptidase) / N-methyltransferase n=1 Tax=Sporolactobacillus nakayamae TaxID=269670 RepID=A0A1I2NSY1_9BACL|nr:A24 family peptidase [Sporolactobacillus nakayamae]SFG06982.1 leader peptidase (prepilin peptidase) / N-methyltransferase [Sporolactobacillus nakayamae]